MRASASRRLRPAEPEGSIIQQFSVLQELADRNLTLGMIFSVPLNQGGGCSLRRTRKHCGPPRPEAAARRAPRGSIIQQFPGSVEAIPQAANPKMIFPALPRRIPQAANLRLYNFLSYES